MRQAAQRVVFVDNPDATVTAVLELKYTGASQKFAWVIPVPGKPTVGVSSNAVFERLDAATAPQYWLEVKREGMCLPQAGSDDPYGPGYTMGMAIDPDNLPEPVEILAHDSVGPYDYVNITLDASLSDPAKVATDWLTSNGYALTQREREVLEPYLKEGLNLLAFKLSEGVNAGAIRPVILTYESELPTIPLRPSALAAQENMGMLVWVFGPSQAVPENYKSLVLNDALIDWLSGPKFVAGTPPSGGAGPFGAYVSKPRNYDAIVAAATHEAGGQGFVSELAQPASQFRERVWSPVDAERHASLSSETYADGLDALLAASRLYAGWDGWKEAVEGATTLPAGVTLEAFGQRPEQYRGMVTVDATKFFALLDARVVKPVIDTAALLTNAPYLTRLYSSMSADHMTLDPRFNYNFDLAQVSNIHIAKQSVACSPTLAARDAPWRIELPQGGVVLGEGSASWPMAEGSLPANLKIVTLSTEGAGSVVQDNSEIIGAQLFEAAGSEASERLTPHTPRTGVLIGGTQSVRTNDPALDEPRGTKSRAGQCSIAQAGTRTGWALASWLPLLALFGVCCRRSARALSKRAVSAEGASA